MHAEADVGSSFRYPRCTISPALVGGGRGSDSSIKLVPPPPFRLIAIPIALFLSHVHDALLTSSILKNPLSKRLVALPGLQFETAVGSVTWTKCLKKGVSNPTGW